jgi:hypothetical protein
MQEDQTVNFAPSYVGHVPWFATLFALYLLFVLLMTVVRAARLAWNLRKSRKAQEQRPPFTSSSQRFWEICNAKVRSIRNFSHLTFLLAVLVLAWNANDVMEMIWTKKTSGFEAVAGGLSESFTIFGAGIVVCIALFCCAMFFESLVLRQRRLLEQKGSESQLPSV